MKIVTKINQYTVDKIIAESKRKPSAPVTVPVFFGYPYLDRPSVYSVKDGKLTIKGVVNFIDFGFKLFDKSDGPEAIPDMIETLNNFIDSFSANGMMVIDDGIFACFDKMFIDLGYVGKMVEADGIQRSPMGDNSIISSRYAETLIIKDSIEYEEYEWSKMVKTKEG